MEGRGAATTVVFGGDGLSVVVSVARVTQARMSEGLFWSTVNVAGLELTVPSGSWCFPDAKALVNVRDLRDATLFLTRNRAQTEEEAAEGTSELSCSYSRL